MNVSRINGNDSGQCALLIPSNVVPSGYLPKSNVPFTKPHINCLDDICSYWSQWDCFSFEQYAQSSMIVTVRGSTFWMVKVRWTDKSFCPARILIMVIHVFTLTWWQNFNSNMWGPAGDIVSDRGSIVIDFGYPSRAQCEFQGRNCENDRICRFLKTGMRFCVGTLICWCKDESFPHKEQLVDDIAHDTMLIFCNEPVAIWVFPCQDCMRRTLKKMGCFAIHLWSVFVSWKVSRGRSSGGDDALRGLLLHGCIGRFWKHGEMVMFSWSLKSNYISSTEFPYTTHIWRFVPQTVW